ncbi:hypothetical protein HDU93_006493, partial [Gonapodya sp. JEL0774]
IRETGIITSFRRRVFPGKRAPPDDALLTKTVSSDPRTNDKLPDAAPNGATATGSSHHISIPIVPVLSAGDIARAQLSNNDDDGESVRSGASVYRALRGGSRVDSRWGTVRAAVSDGRVKTMAV